MKGKNFSPCLNSTLATKREEGLNAHTSLSLIFVIENVGDVRHSNVNLCLHSIIWWRYRWVVTSIGRHWIGPLPLPSTFFSQRSTNLWCTNGQKLAGENAPFKTGVLVEGRRRGEEREGSLFPSYGKRIMMDEKWILEDKKRIEWMDCIGESEQKQTKGRRISDRLTCLLDCWRIGTWSAIETRSLSRFGR